MKVLFTSNYQSPNIYLKEIVDSLKKHCEVTCSPDAFWNRNNIFDVIHIQWIEEIFNWKKINEEDFVKTKECFYYWKLNRCKIVATLHNECPHYYFSENARNVYSFVYNNADAVIHLGNYSKEKIGFNNTRNVIINHPNYNSLTNVILTQEQSRKILKLPINYKIFLLAGAIRKEEEERQIIKAFIKMNSKEKLLLIIPRSSISKAIPSFYKNPIKRVMYEFLITKLKRNNVILGEKFLENKDLAIYTVASDVIISPRIDSLNSGVIFLGYSFGKPVVGAGIGNMKEVLEITGNLPFEPKNTDSILKSMEHALIHSHELGVANKKYSDEMCNVEKIGFEHLRLYQLLHAYPK